MSKKTSGFAAIVLIIAITILGIGGFVIYKNRTDISIKQNLSYECGVCGPQSGIENPNGLVCASGFDCESVDGEIASTVSFCVKPGEGIKKCLGRKVSDQEPYFTFPKYNQRITSPVKITGTVPAGWMFEGSLPIKLLDNNKKLITQGIAQEKIPGSWQSGNPIEFESEIKFTTTATSGFLVIEKDNPSGLPENAKSFELPVNFGKLTPPISEEQAIKLISELPQVKSFLENSKNGKIAVENGYTSETELFIDVYESFTDHNATFNRYRIDRIDGSILTIIDQ